MYEFFGATDQVPLAASFIASAAGTLVGSALLLASAPRLGWLLGGGSALLTFAAYLHHPHRRHRRH